MGTVVLIVLGLVFLGVGVMGLRRWYAERAAGNPTPSMNWMLAVGFFAATICLLLGICLPLLKGG